MNISTCKQSKSKTILVIIAIAALFVTFIVLTFFETRFSEELTNANSQYVSVNIQDNGEPQKYIESIDKISNKITIIKTVNSVIVVIISIGLSGLFTSLVLDKKSIDDIYLELFKKIEKESEVNVSFDNAFLSSATTSTSCHNKKCNLPTGVVNYMIKNVISTTDDGYYYSDYTVSVDCKVEDDYIIKEVKKTYFIVPYDQSYKFIASSKKERLVIVSQTCMAGTGENMKINQIKLGDRNIDLTKDIVKYKEDISDDELPAKQGYKEKYYVCYAKDIETTRKDPIKLSVTYSTKVQKTDLSYVVRVPRLCKKFNLTYTINEKSNYIPYGNAFGFFDDASKTINTSNKKKLEFDFDDWIFPLDGVCIEMRKEEQ